MSNLLSFNNSIYDGHGGKAMQHRAEMRQIAKEVFKEERAYLMEEIKQMMFEAQYKAYQQALNDFLDAIEYDIESVTRIGIEGCRDIFEGKKAQRFISDKVKQIIENKLQNKHFRP